MVKATASYARVGARSLLAVFTFREQNGSFRSFVKIQYCEQPPWLRRECVRFSWPKASMCTNVASNRMHTLQLQALVVGWYLASHSSSTADCWRQGNLLLPIAVQLITRRRPNNVLTLGERVRIYYSIKTTLRTNIAHKLRQCAAKLNFDRITKMVNYPGFKYIWLSRLMSNHRLWRIIYVESMSSVCWLTDALTQVFLYSGLLEQPLIDLLYTILTSDVARVDMSDISVCRTAISVTWRY